MRTRCLPGDGGNLTSDRRHRTSPEEILGKLVLTASPFIVLLALFLIQRWLFR